MEKGRFPRKILAKIALNRKRAGSSPPWQEKYLSVPHQKMGSKKPRNRWLNSDKEVILIFTVG